MSSGNQLFVFTNVTNNFFWIYALFCLNYLPIYIFFFLLRNKIKLMVSSSQFRDHVVLSVAHFFVLFWTHATGRGSDFIPSGDEFSASVWDRCHVSTVSNFLVTDL